MRSSSRTLPERAPRRDRGAHSGGQSLVSATWICGSSRTSASARRPAPRLPAEPGHPQRHQPDQLGLGSAEGRQTRLRPPRSVWRRRNSRMAATRSSTSAGPPRPTRTIWACRRGGEYGSGLRYFIDCSRRVESRAVEEGRREIAALSTLLTRDLFLPPLLPPHDPVLNQVVGVQVDAPLHRVPDEFFVHAVDPESHQVVHVHVLEAPRRPSTE